MQTKPQKYLIGISSIWTVQNLSDIIPKLQASFNSSLYVDRFNQKQTALLQQRKNARHQFYGFTMQNPLLYSRRNDKKYKSNFRIISFWARLQKELQVPSSILSKFLLVQDEMHDYDST